MFVHGYTCVQRTLERMEEWRQSPLVAHTSMNVPPRGLNVRMCCECPIESHAVLMYRERKGVLFTVHERSVMLSSLEHFSFEKKSFLTEGLAGKDTQPGYFVRFKLFSESHQHFYLFP